jgi:hypothetical protein
MRKLIVLCVLALSVTALTAVSGAAARSGPEVLRQGKCSGSTTWKLKLKNDNGRIEAEFEVDQNVVGKRWNVVLRRNGVVVFRGTRTTRAPSGSFEARKLFGNVAGADRVVATGRALGSREVCRGSASIG